MSNYLFLILISINLLVAQESTWVTTEAKINGANITPQKGYELALTSARNEAIKKVVGISITQQTYRNLSEAIADGKSQIFDVFSALSVSNSYGRIIDEEVLEKRVEVIDDIPYYFIKLKARVAEEQGQLDPSFQVKLNTDKDVYYAENKKQGEELVFSVWSNTDCYLHIFNIMANDSVQILLPNNYIQDNSYIVDSAEQVYEKALRNLIISVGVKQDRDISLEALYVVATKKDIPFLPTESYEKIENTILPYETALVDIQKWIIGIPPNMRTEAIVTYEIRRK